MHIKLNSLRAYFLINLMGLAVPLLVGLFTIPLLIKQMGIERFGALSIVWVLIGYFSLFDFGLSRTLTYMAAKLFKNKSWDELKKTFWSILLAISIISLLGSLLIMVAYKLNLHSYIKSTPELSLEIKNSLIPIAVSIPFVAALAALRGFFEADERFYFINFMQMILGIYTFSSPLILPENLMRLPEFVLLILLGRVALLGIHFLYLFKVYPFLKNIEIYIEKTKYKEMLNYGGWLTVSNLLSPLMTSMDRFFLSLLVPTSVIAYYSTPYEMVSRLLIVPASIAKTIFPRLGAESDLEVKKNLVKKALYATGLIMGGIILVMDLVAYPFLSLWLGGDFPTRSTVIIVILSLGVFANSMAYVAYMIVQSQGRSDIHGKLYLFELPFYLLAFYVFTLKWGIAGAATAWSLRLVIDAILHLFFARKLLNA